MISRRQNDRIMKLARELMERGEFDKKAFLEENSALSQTQAGGVMGVRPADVQKFLTPDYIINKRPKYYIKSVREWQERQARLTRKLFKRR